MNHKIEICFGPNCSIRFANDLLSEAEDCQRKDFSTQVCGCLGFCEEGPNIVFESVVHTDMTPGLLRSMMRSASDFSQLGVSQ